MVKQQEVAKSCSKQEVNSIQQGRERELEERNFEETMLPEEQESGHRRIIPENNPSLSDNIQDACVEKQNEDFRIIAKSLMMYQGERKRENKNFNKSMEPEEQEPTRELVLQKKDKELSSNRKAVEPKKQENVDKTLTETIDDVGKSTIELKLQCMMQRMEQMELDKLALKAKLRAM